MKFRFCLAKSPRMCYNNMVDGKITLKTDKNIEVYALNSDGTRETMIDVERDEGKNAVFYLNGALNYEIVRG